MLILNKMNRRSIFLNELHILQVKLNNYKSLLNKTKLESETHRIINEMNQLNEKIKSIELLLENPKL